MLKSQEHKLAVGSLQVQYICLCLEHREVLFICSIIAETFLFVCLFVFFLHKNKLFSDNLGTPGFA